MPSKDPRLKDRDITKTVEVDTLELREKQRARREHSADAQKSMPWALLVGVVVIVAAAGAYLTLA